MTDSHVVKLSVSAAERETLDRAANALGIHRTSTPSTNSNTALIG